MRSSRSAEQLGQLPNLRRRNTREFGDVFGSVFGDSLLEFVEGNRFAQQCRIRSLGARGSDSASPRTPRRSDSRRPADA